jgi:hypothetical protein
MDEDENPAFVDFIMENGKMTSQALTDSFIDNYHGAIVEPPYVSRTIRRQIVRNRFSIKGIERRHILRDDALGIAFFDRIADINPLNFIDIDEVSFAPAEFHQRMGWAPIGHPCIQEQIVIGTRSYSTIAALTPLGFLCWHTFEGFTNIIIIINILFDY